MKDISDETSRQKWKVRIVARRSTKRGLEVIDQVVLSAGKKVQLKWRAAPITCVKGKINKLEMRLGLPRDYARKTLGQLSSRVDEQRGVSRSSNHLDRHASSPVGHKYNTRSLDRVKTEVNELGISLRLACDLARQTSRQLSSRVDEQRGVRRT